MKERIKKLNGLLERMKKLQAEFKGKPMPEDKAKEHEQIAVEAKALQDELDREKAALELENDVKAREKFASSIPDPTLPDDGQPGKHKSLRPKVAGYLRMGHYVLAQKAYQDFAGVGKPKQQVTLAKVHSLFEPVVGLNDEEIKALLTAAEGKAVPVLAADVIEPQRLAEVVRVTEHDMLKLRDILDVQRTTSNAIEYMRIAAYTRAAAAVAQSAQKPEAGISIDLVPEVVRTIAVWLPVTEQQLDDLPALAGIINGELLYDVNKHVEELIAYGSGTGEEFAGFFNDPAILPARAVNFGAAGGDTLIDVIRRGITDVRRAGYEPNGVLADPLDWEGIVLTKGTDEKYIWVVVTEGATQRLWGVPVIETVAMEDFAGVETEERNVLIGDFARGATLWDRQDSAVAVGWINDQFIRNQRTILAELRAAFGIKRPGAFRRYRTQEASAS